MNLLTNLSLFKFMGIQNGHEHELNSFLRTFYPGAKLSEINSIIEILVEKGLVARKGDFIQVVNDNEELIYEWWKKLDLIKIETIHKVDNTRLLNKFFEQLITTHKNIAIPNLESNLFGPDKFLKKDNYYATEVGQNFLNELASIFPEKVLGLSEEIVKSILV